MSQVEFLKAFFLDENEPIHLRLFKPKNAPNSADNYAQKLCVTRATVDSEFVACKLRHWNKTRGVYFVVNSGGDDDKSITRYNAFFAESDTRTIAEQHSLLDACSIQPSIRVETRKSVHAYWLIAGECSEEEWRDIQARFIAYFDGDKSIKNPSRVMRLPGYEHLTYDAATGQIKRKMVCVTHFKPSRRYTVEQMRGAFSAVEQDSTAEPTSSVRQAIVGLYSSWDELTAELRRRIIEHPTAKLNRSGIVDCQGVCHDAVGNTALMVNPATGAVYCNRGCSFGTILQAFGLPERPEALEAELDEGTSYPFYPSYPNPAQPKSIQLGAKARHGLAGEIVSAIEPHTEADPAAILVQLLVAFGNLIGRSAHFVAEADRHYLNLFAVLVGASSRGRKGSSWGHVRRLMAAVDEKWSRCIAGGLTSGEGLIHHARGEDKRIMTVETEFASVLRAQKRENSWLSTTLRQAWDSGDLRVMRRDSPDIIEGAHISIVGHITSDELRSCLQQTDTVNGYANRFLWTSVQRAKKLPEGGRFHEEDITPFVKRLQEAAIKARGVGEMKRDDEARALWLTIYDDLDKAEVSARVAPFLSRAEAQIMRMACLYALLDESNTVRRVHLEAAYALWAYCEASVQLIFGDVATHPVGSRILTALQNAGNRGMTQTEINQLFKGRVKAQEMAEVLKELLRQKRVVSKDEQTQGRTTRHWFIAEAGQEG